jgi:hypothetical protein
MATGVPMPVAFAFKPIKSGEGKKYRCAIVTDSPTGQQSVSSNQTNSPIYQPRAIPWLFLFNLYNESVEIANQRKEFFMQTQVSKLSRIAQVSALLKIKLSYQTILFYPNIFRVPTRSAFTGTYNNEHKYNQRPGCRCQKSTLTIPRMRGRPYSPMQPLNTHPEKSG